MTIIFDYNRTLFDPETDNLFPGVMQMLQRLSSKAKLYLVSRNEPDRETRLDELNIRAFFQRVQFVDAKTAQTFLDIVGQADQVIVVGDSIRDEIAVANQLGWTTVRVKQGKFASELPTTDDEKADLEIMNIADLETIIATYD